ncbi:response regulator transcription factor [Mammaliicoccus lentus]|uniref:response regulator transcription factor n=1 Tax=Mammaliicoccus lentus TaxID=42858 RepID=UPI003A598B60
MAKILIVDDEQDILDICKTYFEYEGHQVITGTNGQEAIEQIDDSIDLMILDIMMPEVNGYEVVKKMREQSLDIPFIYLTAKTQENDTIYALTLGADDYIKKPFSPRELILRSHNLLNRSRKFNKQDYLTFDSMTLCKQEKVLKINDEEILLRVREFDLLWYLAEREKTVISKSELLEKVWGYDYYEDANTVNVHIRRIREKLERQDFHDYVITTVWGLGYKFERAK